MSNDDSATCNVTEAIESHAQGEHNTKAAEKEKVSGSGEGLVCVRVFVFVCMCVSVFVGVYMCVLGCCRWCRC